MKLLHGGEWWLRSKQDPRWNCAGRDDVGGFMMPKKSKKKIEELTEKYGEAPADLTWGYMKD